MNRYCVLVLFNPNSTLLAANLEKLVSLNLIIYIYDNSPNTFAYDTLDEVLKRKVIYRSQMKNIGLSKAYNNILNEILELEMPIEYNDDLILFLDQDSEIEANAINKLFEAFDEEDDNVMIIAGNPIRRDGIPYRQFHDKLNDVDFAISSYSVYRLTLFKKIGLFQDDFFIDHIDTDYCARIKKNNYQIKIMREAFFSQPIGVRSYTIFGKYLFPIPSTQRTYYQIRNAFLSYRRGGVSLKFLLKEIKNRLIITILSGVHEKDFAKRLGFFMQGIKDGIIQ